MTQLPLLLLVCCFGLCAYSQDEPRRFAGDRIRYSRDVSFENDPVFSIGVNADFPVGDWKKFSGLGIGPEAGCWYHFNDFWSATGRLGFNKWFGKQYISPGMPGAKYENQFQWYGYAGARYNFTQTWWLNPELGYSHNTFGSAKEGSVAWGIQAGADIYGPGSVIGIGAGYQSFSFEGELHNHFGVRVRIYIGIQRERYNENDE